MQRLRRCLPQQRPNERLRHLPRTDAVQSQACDRRDPYRRKRLTSAIFTQQGVEL
jgi:hypothetical protein